MLIDNIKTGDRVEITLESDSAVKKTYLSQVENLLDDGKLLLHVPISYGQLVKLPTVDRYSFLIFTEKGMLRFDSAILSYLKEDGFNMMSVKLLSEGERVQRRQFFRYSIVQPMKFSVVDGNDFNPDGLNDKDQAIEAMTKDLGGGGVRFVCNELLEEDTKIKCFLMLGENFLITIGKVLHRQVFPKSTLKYQYRVIFLGMLPTEQEKIIQFIFSEQRKSLQRKEW